MKKIILLIILLFSLNVKAEEACKREELLRLREVAKKISFSYEFHETKDENGEVTGGYFHVILDNVSKEVKAMVIYSWIGLDFDEFKPDENGTASSEGFNKSGYEPGNSVKITIKAYVNNGCIAEDLLTKTVKLPYYNSFLSSETCQSYPDFKYCQNQFLSNRITQRQFDSEFAKYLKSKEKIPGKLVSDDTNLYIFIGVVVSVPLLLYGIVSLIKWHKKKEEL